MQRLNREDFLHRLESVQAGLASRETVEQSDCFLFQNGTVSTFNDEVCCSHKSMLEDSFQGAVKAAKLLDVLRLMPEEEITIEHSANELSIIGKKRRADLLMEKEITSRFSSVEKPKEWTALHDDFGEAIGIVQQCAGEDQSQFKACAVHIHPKWVEASDMVQLCRWRMKTGIKEPVLVRKHSIKHVSSLGMTEMSETDAWLHFRNAAGLRLACRRFVEDFPDLGPVFDVKGEVVNLPKGLVDAADRAQIFSQENTDYDNLIQVELRPGKVRVKGQGVSGRYRETRKVNYSGPVLEFLISPKLLMDIVEKHNECLVSKERIKVNGSRFEYCTCLTLEGEEEESQNGDGNEEETPAEAEE